MDSLTLGQQDADVRDTAPEEREATFNDDDSLDQVPPRDVVAYNELRSGAELYRMWKKGNLSIDPEFQRDFVWKNPMQTRFIDSLIKHIPVPSMCIALDRSMNKRIVVDGRQRVKTIIRFLQIQEKPWRLTKLDDISPSIAGKTPEQIRTDKPEYYDRVEEHSLPITVFDCNLGKVEHMDYIFKIFHRLNSGGEKLNNQEIRNCISGGPLNQLLRELDREPKWRVLNRMKPNNNYRFVKQELILRFFSFLDEGANYRGRMAKFLNDYMRVHRDDDEEILQGKKILFRRVVNVFSKVFGDQEPPHHIQANIINPVMVSIAKNIDALEELPLENLQERYYRLTVDETFADKASLSNVKIVEGRLQTAEKIFGSTT